MGKWQNLDYAFFEEVEGEYDVPIIDPVYELPSVKRYIEFAYCRRCRADRNNRKDIAVHFFEDDFKFESAWTFPDRTGQMLSEFGFVIGPDFSQYIDFPKAVQIYNHYRNNWLVRYWQVLYNITVIPTIMWGMKDTYDWCFDGYPKNSVVAVSNVGLCRDKELKQMFYDGYNEMMNRLNPIKILMFSRNFEVMPGNVQYISWELYKEAQR